MTLGMTEIKEYDIGYDKIQKDMTWRNTNIFKLYY